MGIIEINTTKVTSRELVEKTLRSQFEAGNFDLKNEIPNTYKTIIQSYIVAKYSRFIPLTTVARYTNVFQKALKIKENDNVSI